MGVPGGGPCPPTFSRSQTFPPHYFIREFEHFMFKSKGEANHGRGVREIEGGGEPSKPPKAAEKNLHWLFFPLFQIEPATLFKEYHK